MVHATEQKHWHIVKLLVEKGASTENERIYNDENERIDHSCCICIQEYNDTDVIKISTGSCNHHICYDCLMRHLCTKDNCPMCRTPQLELTVLYNADIMYKCYNVVESKPGLIYSMRPPLVTNRIIVAAINNDYNYFEILQNDFEYDNEDIILATMKSYIRSKSRVNRELSMNDIVRNSIEYIRNIIWNKRLLENILID